MPGDKDAKTEPPTPRRRREARASGQVAKSQDLSASFLLLGGLLALRFLGPAIWNRLLMLYRTALAGADAADGRQMIPMAVATGKAMTEMLAPFLVVMVLLTLVVLYFQVGLLWTFKPLMPSLNKLNPITGLGRIFSARSVVMLVLNVGKLALV
ncbi:MAG: EscU/YscU/HrcU family type III secretion system export apparatus switch protein, partial [bacterium]|nr:EscU/YscU/HrcU family type III secretion system export apparatus switch protein [bacterium]